MAEADDVSEGLICRLRLKLLLWNYAFKRLGNQSQNPRQKWFRYQNKRHQTQKMKMKRKEYFPKQGSNSVVTATTTYGRSTRIPSRYREEMNAATVTGLALQNYYTLIYKKRRG